jgi:hypothetical protein
MMLSPKGLVSPNSDALYIRNGLRLDQSNYTAYAGFGYWPQRRTSYQIQAQAIECAPGMCNLPPGMVLGRPMMWSQRSTWPNGTLPSSGSNVIINSTMWVVMDVNPPPLAKLQVDGMLQFLDTDDRYLDVNLMQVNGVLQVGTANSPFQHRAVITLHGTRSSDTLITSEGLFMGNKVMCVLGNANLYGIPRVPWTRLAPGATAQIGATSIVVAGQVDWTTGDRLAISSTEYEWTQTEEMIVSSRSVYNNVTDSTTVQLTSPLLNKHVSVVVQAKDNGSRPVTLSAAVALLNRNVVIQGAIDQVTLPDYGGTIVVTEASSAGVSLRASTVFDNVQFLRLGKLDTEHPGIRYHYGRLNLAPTYTNVVKGCSFTNTYNAAIQGQALVGFNLTSTTCYNVSNHGVTADYVSSGALVKQNLVLFTTRDPTLTTIQALPRAAFFFESHSAFVPGGFDGNMVASAFDIGYLLVPEPCGTSSSIFGYNEVSASRVGVFLLNYYNGDSLGTTSYFAGVPSQPACLKVSGFKSWKNSHLGVVAVDARSNLMMSNMVVSDNHIGIYMQFLRDSLDNFASLDSSVVMGSTSASTCDQSLLCRAVWGNNDVFGGDNAGILFNSQGCKSMFKSGIRRIGLVFPAYPAAGKTCPYGKWTHELCTPQVTFH